MKADFHMIDTIAVIVGKNVQQSLLSCGSQHRDHGNHMETSLYRNWSAIKIAMTAQLFWQRS